MNTKLIIWILGIFLGVIVVGVIWYAVFAPKATPPQATQPSATLPISGSITPAPTVTGKPSLAPSPQIAQTMTLTTQNGAAIVTNDFIHNGVTIPDTANAGNYLLAGNLGYCVSNPQQCQAASSTDFTVYYNSTQQSFIIDLIKEPMGQARLDMEQFMSTVLGLTQQQMCSLNYLVGVTRYVNSQFTGKNLGFSFCPGATVLPQ